MRILALILLSFGNWWLAAAAPKAPTKAASPAASQKALSDPELEQAIRARFARSKISVNKFTVRVQGGTATIEGSTAVIQHKATATRLARLAGARAVQNMVTISAEARAAAAKNLTEGRRRAQVKRSDVSGRQ